MENIFNMLKSLYKGDNVTKKHLLLALLLVLPSMAGCVLGYLDKETPKELFVPLLIIGSVLFVLSLVPYVGMAGMYLSFAHNKYHNKEEGIPLLNKDMFITGLKAIPLYLVWCCYWVVFVIMVCGLCFLPAIISGILSISSSVDSGVTLLIFLLSFFVFIVLCLGMYLLVPFSTYVSVAYAKNFEYTSELFNPLIIVDFIKKSFKSSVLIALKYVLVNLIVGFAASIVYVVAFVMIIFIGLVAMIIGPEDIPLTSSPLYIGPSALIMIVMAVVQIYASIVVGYAMAGNLIEVYKEEIEG